MSRLHIDHDRCDLCEECISTCPFASLQVVGGRLKVDETCVLCGACQKACPLNAISMPHTASTGKDPGAEDHAYSGVWVFAEPLPPNRTNNGAAFHEVTFELLGKGRDFADQLGEPLTVVGFGHTVAKQTAQLSGYGADRLLAVSRPELLPFRSEQWAAVLADLVRTRKPEIVLCGATSAGRAFFPRTAALLQTGLTADCTGLKMDMESRTLLQTRPAFGGNIMATIVCPDHRPQMATVRPNVLPEARPDGTGPGEVTEPDIAPSALQTDVEVLNEILDNTGAQNITEADAIVAGGRGVGGADGFDVIRELASVLGASVGASRAAVDAGWIPYAHQVGQTGLTVQPELYVACGISGAVQHIVGMRGSDIVIAINSDPDAPIFDHADYGLVGDLHALVPRLTDRIRKRRDTGNE
ncbi:MAG: FAD-binding protein [Candidatus Brocadiia bacterium]